MSKTLVELLEHVTPVKAPAVYDEECGIYWFAQIEALLSEDSHGERAEVRVIVFKRTTKWGDTTDITRIRQGFFKNEVFEDEGRVREALRAWAHVAKMCLSVDRYLLVSDLFSERMLNEVLASKQRTFDGFVRAWLTKSRLLDKFCYPPKI